VERLDGILDVLLRHALVRSTGVRGRRVDQRAARRVQEPLRHVDPLASITSGGANVYSCSSFSALVYVNAAPLKVPRTRIEMEAKSGCAAG